MNVLFEIRDSDVFRGARDLDPSRFAEKKTSRIILLNSLGNVALLRVDKYQYHKLPGGGVERGESPKKALERELLEEMGCRARIMAEVGIGVEYKNDQARKQISYCYLGEQVGRTVPPNFTDSERDHGYEAVWMEDIDAAIRQVEVDEPIGYSRKFIQAREAAFLRAARDL
ncbi:MAG TPA: NUDIX domain-containing protein [Candidatus Saccharimonadales bacterium]